MSDTTSPPLDTGSSADPSSTNPPNTDPNATNPTDPNASDPNATNPTDPNAGATDPNAGATDPNAGASDPNAGVPADPNAGTSTSGVGGVDPNAGSAHTTGAASLPNATPNASLGVQTSATATPTPTPSSIAGSDRDSGGAVVAFDSKNAQYRKAIIIASAVSGAVGLILVVVVIFVVYRRRNRRNRNNATFVNAAAPRPLARTGSDATWIGTRIEDGPKESFNEGKLEAGSRTSDAGSIDSDATLADFAAARAKSGAFSTPTHTPRPSLEKLKIANMPMVPEDPFEAPRLSMADRPRPSLEQMINPVPQAIAAPRPRRSGAPNIRINSKGSYASEVVVEQSFDNGIRSPGFPVVPLVTPIEAPAHWRAHLDDEFIPPPPRRDSMASLSRQSSRASSRNSRDLDAEVISPSKKSVFSTIAKKRRSRADSIDPFRKSAATMMVRRKSRAESMASRKSRAESVGAPKSPGLRRKSRGGSVHRAQSAAVNPIFDRTQDMGRSMPAPQVPRTPIGLPQTPRTPTAARRSRVVNGYEPRTPRTPRALPLPPTPRTSGIQQVPRTAGLERPRTPGMERPRTPGMERPRTPGMERLRIPGTERPRTPGTDRPRTPGAERPRTPAAQEPRTPVSAPQPRTPHEQRTPRTPGGRTRQPRAAVPRTPTSLDDAHWDSVPLPAVPPAPVPRPLPSAPLPGGRAELRLSQLSRALSEVSRDSPI